MKHIARSVVIAVLLCAAAAIGGVMVGLTVSQKDASDLIWVLYSK